MVKDISGEEGIDVKCSICGEKMMCSESMVSAAKHLCNFCSDVCTEGMSDNEIKEHSMRERELSKYYGDIEYLADWVISIAFEESRLSKSELKNMKPHEIMEEFYDTGVRDAMDFMLHIIDPAHIRRVRFTMETGTQVALSLKNAGFSSEEIKQIIKFIAEDDKQLDEFTKHSPRLDIEKLRIFKGKIKNTDDAIRMLNECAIR